MPDDSVAILSGIQMRVGICECIQRVAALDVALHMPHMFILVEFH